jgi:hypothetical protein
MSCLLPLIAGACLMPSDGLSIELQGDWRMSGRIVYETRRGPYKSMLARPAIYWSAQVNDAWTLDYGINHMSALTDNSDAGSQYMFVRVKWQPLKAFDPY